MIFIKEINQLLSLSSVWLSFINLLYPLIANHLVFLR